MKSFVSSQTKDRVNSEEGRFYVGAEATHAPRFTSALPQIQSLDGKCSRDLKCQCGVRIFRFRRTDKMDSLMKGLMGQLSLPQNFWARTAPDSETISSDRHTSLPDSAELNQGKDSSDFDPKQQLSYFSGPKQLCKISSKSITNSDHRSADRRTEGQNSHFCMLKLNVKLLIKFPAPKLSSAHLSPR